MVEKSKASRVKQEEQQPIEGRFLTGMKEICRYCSRSEATVIGWIRDMGFPAKKIGGIWESNTGLVDRWRMRQISGE